MTITAKTATSTTDGIAQARSGRRNRHAFEAWLILVPVFAYYFLFAIVPVLTNIAVSFTHWNGITAPAWAGLDNYLRLLRDAQYQQVFANTAVFTLVSMLVGVPLGLLVAVLLNQKVRGLGLYRSLWYIPTVTSAAIMSQVVSLFISPYGGVLNQILSSLGQTPVIWTINSDAMRLIIIGFMIWRGLGGTMILYLAALQGIASELYDAAMVDGAGTVQRFWYITVPQVRHMTWFVVVTGIIAGFQVFEPILLISRGGPFNQTNVVINQIYADAFQNADFGLATAAATVLGLILLWASLAAQRLMRQGED